MVKDHSESERGNPLPPHGLLFLINSKGSFICIIPQIGLHIPWPLLHLFGAQYDSLPVWCVQRTTVIKYQWSQSLAVCYNSTSLYKYKHLDNKTTGTSSWSDTVKKNDSQLTHTQEWSKRSEGSILNWYFLSFLLLRLIPQGLTLLKLLLWLPLSIPVAHRLAHFPLLITVLQWTSLLLPTHIYSQLLSYD